MKTFLEYLIERRKTPLFGQAGEEWDEVVGAMNRGDIPMGFTRKNFQNALTATSSQPHDSINWKDVQNTDATNDGPDPHEIGRLYLKYKGKKLDPSALSKDPSIIALHRGGETLLAGNTRAMLGGSVKRIRVGGRKYNITAGSTNHHGSDNHLPQEPGTEPIPEGHVRLYHQTSLKYIPSIIKTGITIAHAKGIEGPRAVYATETPFYGEPGKTPTIEFSVPKNKFSSPFVLQDVSPKAFIAVHLPWHKHARYFENNQTVSASVLSGEHDDLLEDPIYGPAIRYHKKKYK